MLATVRPAGLASPRRKQLGQIALVEVPLPGRAAAFEHGVGGFARAPRRKPVPAWLAFATAPRGG